MQRSAFLRSVVFGAALASGGPAHACELALALAVDVSGSVDPREYRIQMQGLAEALRDGVVSEALVRGEAQVMLMQWSGNSRQRISIPWLQVRNFDDVEALALRIESTGRAWRNFSTAIGEALSMADEALSDVSCKRLVIDVSGDGRSNEGREPKSVHARLAERGAVVNALVIENEGDDLTGYFWENVIMGEGAFVVTANGFEEYPERIRRKLIRETTLQLSELAP
jgi:Ca-activated chloride channel family protein